MKKKIILRFEPKKFNKKLLQIIALECQIAILKKENIKAFEKTISTSDCGVENRLITLYEFEELLQEVKDSINMDHDYKEII